MKKANALGRAFVAATAIFGSVASNADPVYLDQLSIIRNTVSFFSDPFSDGIVPPSGPNGANTYGVSGSIPNGSESGGLLLLDSVNGVLTVNAAGEGRRSLTMTVRPTDGGLTNTDTFASNALFDIALPPGPLFSGYAIRFVDGDGSVPVDDILQLQVGYSTTTHNVQVTFLAQDISGGTITTLASLPFLPPPGADQVNLILSHPIANNGIIQASFQFLDGGIPVGSPTTFGPTGTAFVGENSLRTQILVAQAVPEPATLALLGVGLAGLGFSRRKP